MLKIRLKRIGKKGQAFYRLVVMESTNNRDGKPVSDLGAYNPHLKDSKDSMNIDKEAVKMWLERGAQPTETVAQFFKKMGLVKASRKGSVLSKGKTKKKEAKN